MAKRGNDVDGESEEHNVKCPGLVFILLNAVAAVAAAGSPGAGSPAASGASADSVLVLRGRTELPGYSGDFDHFAVDLKGNRLFLAAEDHGTLEVFDLRTGKHLRSVAGFETPHSIFPIRQTHRLLITDGSETIKLLDDGTLAPVGTIKLHPGADSIGFDGGTGHLYVVTGGKDVKLKESWLEEIDPVTTHKIGEVHLDADHVEAMAVEQHGPHLYINVTDKNYLAVIDKAARKIVAQWPIHGAAQNALAQLDETTRRLFIVARDPGRFIVLNSDTGAHIASLAAPKRVDAEIFDVANRRRGIHRGLRRGRRRSLRRTGAGAELRWREDRDPGPRAASPVRRGVPGGGQDRRGNHLVRRQGGASIIAGEGTDQFLTRGNRG